jgi:arylsulfatase A-like enzyme
MAFSTTAHELNRRALRVMRERPEKPFFLYLHYTDVHAPYHPSPEYFDEAPLEIDGMGVVSNYDLEKMYRQMEIDSPEIEARVRAMYAATVREMDAEIGWLMTALRKRKLLNNTVVVVTSDHGESFREHGTTRHGYNVYPEVVDVPLIVWSPTFPLPKGRVKEQVRSIDIAPTLLDLAGIETPANYDGRSLLPADSAPLETRTATSVVGQHSKLPDRDVIAIRSDQHLYIHERREDLVEFYELTGDPGALKNLGRDHPRVPDYASLEPSTSSEEPAQVQLDEKLQEMLRAVGYLEEN